MQLDRVLDLTLHTKIHEGATCWAFVPVLTNTQTHSQDLLYDYYVPVKESREPEVRPTFAIHSWRVEKDKLRLTPDNARSPWFTGPVEVIQLFRKMQKQPRIGDRYRLNMGIKSSANKVYFLNSIRRTEPKLVEAKTLGNKSVNLEDDLVYPLVRGQHIGPWKFDYAHVLVPHRPPDWRPIPEATAKAKYPEMYEHVSRSEYKRLLETRDDYSPNVGPYYMIFRLSRNKVDNWKVAYAENATQLEACVIPSKIDDPVLGERHVMVDHSAYFITPRNQNEALFLTAILNSTPIRSFSYCFGRPKAGKPFRAFTSWTIAILPVPRYDPKDDCCMQLVKKAREAQSRKANLATLQMEVDEMAGELYGLSKRDVEALGKHYLVLSGQADG